MLIDRRLTILYVNRSFEKITGYTRTQAIGQKPSLLHSGLHGRVFYRALWDELKRKGQWTGVIWNRRQSGTLYPQALTIYPAESASETLYVGQFSDVSAAEVQGDAQTQTLYYDALTQLPNRQLFSLFLESRVRQVAPDGRGFAVLVVNIHRFRKVNDLYGHDIGDSFLQEAVRRLSARLSPDSILGRLAADEFAIILEGDDVAAHRQLGERLLHAFNEPLNIRHCCHLLSVALGCAIWPEHGTSSQELFLNADRALALAQSDPRSAMRVYDPVSARAQSREAMIAKHLDLALHHRPEQFSTVFQPIVRSVSRELVGYEVLLRWSSPDLLEVGPAEFIPVAESAGLMPKVTARMLQSLAVNIQDRPPNNLPDHLFLGINVSAEDINHGQLTAQLEPVLERLDELGWYAVIELTESQWLSANQNNAEQLDQLRARGVKIAIDDFGSGYSNLSYLNQLPLDLLKTDRSLLASSPGQKPMDYPILRGVLALAGSLGLSVIIEGVESESQCLTPDPAMDLWVQGFLLGRPMPWGAQLHGVDPGQ